MLKTRPTKKELELLTVSETVVRRRKAIEQKIQQWESKLEELQKTCLHYNSWYENKGSTGSWDRDDHYWRDYECEDCGKRWTTDQSYEQEKKYPYAVKGKRDSDGEWEVYKW